MTVSPDVVSAAFRAASFVALLQGAGLAIFRMLFGHQLGPSQAAIRRLGIGLIAAAIPLLLIQFVLEAARMAGDFSGIVDPELQKMAATSPAAAALIARLCAIGLIAASFVRSSRTSAIVGFAGAIVAAASFALMGHLSLGSHGVATAATIGSHVLVAAFWFGSIAGLYVVTDRETQSTAGTVIASFSRLAQWVVPILAFAGVTAGLMIVTSWSTFAQPYGQLLLAKVVGFGLLVGLAAANRLSWGPAVAGGRSRAFRVSLFAEYVVISAVLGATAAMTTLYSPEA